MADSGATDPSMIERERLGVGGVVWSWVATSRACGEAAQELLGLDSILVAMYVRCRRSRVWGASVVVVNVR
jgi:hypothetical protein